jgi:type II secretory pathway pseudopilin PulG
MNYTSLHCCVVVIVVVVVVVVIIVIIVVVVVVVSMKQMPSLKAKSRSENLNILWNLKFHYRVHRKSSLDRALSLFHTLHTLVHCLVYVFKYDPSIYAYVL